MNGWEVFGVCLSLVVSAIIVSWKSFFAGYGDTIGKNLATSHDIAVVLDNLRKQRHEDIKREIGIEIMRAYGSLLQASLLWFAIATEVAMLQQRNNVGRDTVENAQRKHEEAHDHYQSAMAVLWQLEQVARLVFPSSICEKMRALKLAFNEFTGEMYSDNTKFISLHKDIEQRQEELSIAIKAELQI